MVVLWTPPTRRKTKSIWAARRQSRLRRVSQNPLRGTAGEWGSRVVGSAHEPLCYRRDHAGSGRWSRVGERNAVSADRFFPRATNYGRLRPSVARICSGARAGTPDWTLTGACRMVLTSVAFMPRLPIAGTCARASWLRVIDYRLMDIQGAEPIYRLITTILDPAQAPAKELAALYHERWEIENRSGRTQKRICAVRRSCCSARRQNWSSRSSGPFSWPTTHPRFDARSGPGSR